MAPSLPFIVPFDQASADKADSVSYREDSPDEEGAICHTRTGGASRKRWSSETAKQKEVRFEV